MSLVSPVFEQHYQNYLKQMADIDFEILAPLIGGRCVRESSGQGIKISYFNTPYTISPRGIIDDSGRKPGYDTCIILSRYLIMAQERADAETGIAPGSTSAPKKNWAGFRDLKESGPLTVYFKDNVEKVISESLAGRLPLGIDDFSALAPSVPELELNYDLSLEVMALPMMPMLILANDAEEGFPATCSVLYPQDVETVLDAECIAMAGYKLAEIIQKILL